MISVQTNKTRKRHNAREGNKITCIIQYLFNVRQQDNTSTNSDNVWLLLSVQRQHLVTFMIRFTDW